MNKEFCNFIMDYVALLKEKSEQSLAQSQSYDSDADAAFSQGANFAYYDALDVLKAQLESFGYQAESIELFAAKQSSLPQLGK